MIEFGIMNYAAANIIIYKLIIQVLCAFDLLGIYIGVELLGLRVTILSCLKKCLTAIYKEAKRYFSNFHTHTLNFILDRVSYSPGSP